MVINPLVRRGYAGNTSDQMWHDLEAQGALLNRDVPFLREYDRSKGL